MSGYTIRVVAMWPYEEAIDGQFLSRLDVEAGYGAAAVAWTPDPSKALVFPDVRSALAARNAQSTRYPIRADGLPNRPLSAFTVEFVKVP